ncbi:MAG TPA: hypothetical protein VLJ58_08570 [Ramlibacter sp.]|nr:hypothetical protein [Ramlibacter sp.]
MRTQRDIDSFTLAFHRQAIARLRRDRSLLDRAVATLDRWRAQRGATNSDPYFEEWRTLLEQGVDVLEGSVCTDSDHAAALRNVSPLGFALSPHERAALHRLAKA